MVPDPRVLRVSFFKNAKVSLKAVEDCLQAYLSELGFERMNLVFEGPGVRSSFSIEFAGLVPVASKMATKAIRSLKLGDGDYRKFSVKDPSDVETAFLINPDKNGRLRKSEGATRRLANLIKDKYPDLPIYARRSEGFINCQLQQLIRLRVDYEKVGVSCSTKLSNESKADCKTIDSSFLHETFSGLGIPNVSSLPVFTLGRSLSFIGWNTRVLCQGGSCFMQEV